MWGKMHLNTDNQVFRREVMLLCTLFSSVVKIASSNTINFSPMSLNES